jgi:hypothetical protein
LRSSWACYAAADTPRAASAPGWKTAKILVEASDDKARTPVGQPEGRGDDRRLEELHFVDPDYVPPRAEIAGQRVVIFKPRIDDRFDGGARKMPAHPCYTHARAAA